MMFLQMVRICFLLLSATTSMAQKSSKCEAVHCNSSNFAYTQCKVPKNINSIELLQQHSFSGCVRGKTFGTYGKTVWVDIGCRGAFGICYGANKQRYNLHTYYKVTR